MISKIYGKFLAPLILSQRLAVLGKSSRFSGWVHVSGAGNIFIGDDFFAGPDLYISTSRYAKVTIGQAVMFGPGVMILGGDHDYSYSKGHMRFNAREQQDAKPVCIDDGAWVGARTIVLSGADIGEGAVVGAGSIVKGTVPPFCVAVGNPLRIIKSRFKEIAQLEECLLNTGSKHSLDDLLALYDFYQIKFSSA